MFSWRNKKNIFLIPLLFGVMKIPQVISFTELYLRKIALLLTFFFFLEGSISVVSLHFGREKQLFSRSLACLYELKYRKNYCTTPGFGVAASALTKMLKFYVKFLTPYIF